MPRQFRCQMIGDGKTEDTPFMPAISLYADAWASQGDERQDETQKLGTMLVEVPDRATIDSKWTTDPRITETSLQEKAVIPVKSIGAVGK